MSERRKIQPDLGFKRELSSLSGAQLNQCMQCGNCSAVCSLAPADRPFPRKEMVWAGWGLKEKLIGNIFIEIIKKVSTVIMRHLLEKNCNVLSH